MACRNYSGNYNLVCAPEDLLDGTLALQPAPGANPVCLESRWGVVRVYDKAGYIVSAWEYAFAYYTDEAIIRHTSEDFYEILQGLLPFLQQAIVLTAAATAAGAGAGAAGGSLFFGIGAVPGAVFGAEAGLDAAGIILNMLGVGYLLIYLKDHLVEMGDPLMKGTRMAIDSCGAPGNLKAAGHRLADGFGVFASLLLQAAASYVLHEGYKVGRNKLGQSRLGERFARFASRVGRRDECLRAMGLFNEPPFVKKNVMTVIDALEARTPDLPVNKLVESLKGVDLNNKVEPFQEVMKKGDIWERTQRGIVRSGSATFEPGDWFTKSGVPAERTGISAGNRVLKRRFRVRHDGVLSGVKSRAAGIVDKWTPGRTREVITPDGKAGEYATGGGEQYLLPGAADFLEEIP